MKHIWPKHELTEHFTLFIEELALLIKKPAPSRIGFAVMLKFFQHEGRFPRSRKEIPKQIVRHLAEQLDVPSEAYYKYNWQGRSIRTQRTQIRQHLGFKKWSRCYMDDLIAWLQINCLPEHFRYEQLEVAAASRLQELKIEAPRTLILERIVNSALSNWEQGFFKQLSGALSNKAKAAIDQILANDDHQEKKNGDSGCSFRTLKSDPGKISINTISAEIKKLETIRQAELSPMLFVGLPYNFLKRYRDRVITEPAREGRRHPAHIRYALMAVFLYLRGREITDDLVDLMIRTVKRIGTRAETNVEKAYIEEVKKVRHKNVLLYKMASTAWDQPDAPAREMIFPAVGEKTIQNIIHEYKNSGSEYTLKVNIRMRASYRTHYRRMLPKIIEALEFKSNNRSWRPIIEAIRILRKYIGSSIQYYPVNEEIPTDGIIPADWRELIYKTDAKGNIRIQRTVYELCVFNALREKLRCKEIWGVGADRFRSPDEDLPTDFEQNRTAYYEMLKQPLEPDVFIARLQDRMDRALKKLNKGIGRNPHVEILKTGKGRIKLSPLKAQSEPQNLQRIKAEINRRWQTVSLLDILKEADLRVHFTRFFRSVAQREAIDQKVLQKRLLLIFYALATNAGVKRVAAGDYGENYSDLMYVLRRYIRKPYLRQAIATLVNETLHIRRPHIWGEATTACASDSKQFGAWDQNLLTEWHQRYSGRGIMIYWHVEKGAACIYSQLKACSSSEAAAMIEGVIRHSTEMSLEKQYVETHCQSFVGFAFCHLLGFQLLPRFKSIKAKKLYRPFAGMADAYPNLQPVLTRPINWELIRRQYDQMIKYAKAIRLGTAETESILRRFTRENLKHPTYQALLELGRALRTVFLCEYLHSETLRREINEELNVIELWNDVNDFFLFGKGGEIATNRRESQELAMLCLHLLQNCLVYINTLMVQQILNDPVNPYGIFRLDMDSRLLIESDFREVA